jgi:hypothetical protein
MTPSAQTRLLDRLERLHGPRVRAAFERSIRDLRGQVNLADLIRAIEARDVNRALAVIGVGAAVYRDFERAIVEAFEQAGRSFTNLLPKNVRGPDGNRVTFRYDMRNPSAERLLRRASSDLVTRISGDQVESLRRALTAGMEAGQNPRTTALRIAGRIDPATGRRAGGIIGLSGPQAGYLDNARGYLGAGDARYFGLELRDRRLDGAIRAAMEAGRPVPAALRERALTRYSDRMLKHRADMIARTETLNAMRAASHDAIDQAAEVAGLPDDAIERVWSDTGDGRTRPDHAAANGQTVGKNEPFIVGGEALMYPGDASLGASGAQTIACRCVETVRVDWNRAAR